jgi:hypothetical protein
MANLLWVEGVFNPAPLQPRSCPRSFRDGPLGVADFSPEIGGGIPPAVGKGHKDQGDGKRFPEQGGRRKRPGEVNRRSVLRKQAAADKDKEKQHLEEGQPVLDPASDPKAAADEPGGGEYAGTDHAGHHQGNGGIDPHLSFQPAGPLIVHDRPLPVWLDA